MLSQGTDELDYDDLFDDDDEAVGEEDNENENEERSWKKGRPPREASETSSYLTKAGKEIKKLVHAMEPSRVDDTDEDRDPYAVRVLMCYYCRSVNHGFLV